MMKFWVIKPVPLGKFETLIDANMLITSKKLRLMTE